MQSEISLLLRDLIKAFSDLEQENGVLRILKRLVKAFSDLEQENAALKVQLKKLEKCGQKGCCPVCGGHDHHDTICTLAALIYPHYAEAHKRDTETTVIESLFIDVIASTNNVPLHAALFEFLEKR